jgi:uncharacterized protein
VTETAVTAGEGRSDRLQQAGMVWMTEDSVSMVLEALTAGCQVGPVAIPRLREDRITTAVDRLIKAKQVLPLAEFVAGQVFGTAQPLAEADRTVRWLIEQGLIKQ